jgi:hypothetical protein
MVLRGFFGQKTNAYPTKSTNFFIKYKMYLQALPYFDCLEGDCEVTKWTPPKGGFIETHDKSKYN